MACSLCGTDVHVYNWDPPFSEGRMNLPITTGHEMAGVIVKCGINVRDLCFYLLFNLILWYYHLYR